MYAPLRLYIPDGSAHTIFYPYTFQLTHPSRTFANPTTPRHRLKHEKLIQPWHPSSTLVHESALAVEKVAPEKFWIYSNALFTKQREYFDVNVVNETRNQTYRRLAELATSLEINGDAVYKLLVVADKPDGDAYNIGNQVTNDVKFITKAARQVSAHVTPTVFFNGVMENSISSGWTLDQWTEWINTNIV
ncbi:hypothetical protein ABW20_dc0107622 [Dactylellina cionopaga]|nr:hypothetical protein ABW20_dc0107622 [Dactylellina cionopaga]